MRANISAALLLLAAVALATVTVEAANRGRGGAAPVPSNSPGSTTSSLTPGSLWSKQNLVRTDLSVKHKSTLKGPGKAFFDAVFVPILAASDPASAVTAEVYKRFAELNLDVNKKASQKSASKPQRIELVLDAITTDDTTKLNALAKLVSSVTAQAKKGTPAYLLLDHLVLPPRLVYPMATRDTSTIHHTAWVQTHRMPPVPEEAHTLVIPTDAGKRSEQFRYLYKNPWLWPYVKFNGNNDDVEAWAKEWNRARGPQGDGLDDPFLEWAGTNIPQVRNTVGGWLDVQTNGLPKAENVRA